jgi:hypothetical protein
MIRDTLEEGLEIMAEALVGIFLLTFILILTLVSVMLSCYVVGTVYLLLFI